MQNMKYKINMFYRDNLSSVKVIGVLHEQTKTEFTILTPEYYVQHMIDVATLKNMGRLVPVKEHPEWDTLLAPIDAIEQVCSFCRYFHDVLVLIPEFRGFVGKVVHSNVQNVLANKNHTMGYSLLTANSVVQNQRDFFEFDFTKDKE